MSPAPQPARNRITALFASFAAQRHRDLLSVARDYLTILALLVGGAWTVWTVIQYRDLHPIITTEHHISHRPLPLHKVLLSVDVDVTNAGKVLLKPLLSRVSILQVLPLTAEGLEKVRQGTLASNNRRDIDWPKIDGKDYPKELHQRQLEPGETEPFHYDFILPDFVEVVAIYTLVNNPELTREHGSEAGWQRLTLCDLRAAGTACGPAGPAN